MHASGVGVYRTCSLGTEERKTAGLQRNGVHRECGVMTAEREGGLRTYDCGPRGMPSAERLAG